MHGLSYLGVFTDAKTPNTKECIETLFIARLGRKPTEKEHTRLQNASKANLYYELLLTYKRENPPTPKKTTNVIPVLMLFHDNEEYCRLLLPRVQSNIQSALETLGFRPSFYMYENDSMDQTSRMLWRFNGYVCSETLQNTSAFSAMGRTSLRCNRIAFLRNALVGWALPEIVKAPFVMCVDSNLSLSKSSLVQMFQAMGPLVAMATPNTVDASCLTHYYDTYAYTPLHGKPKSDNILCPKENCIKCDTPFHMAAVQHVQSAFGGACVLSSKALLKSFWWSTNNMCEHIAFCRQLSPGHVVIVRDAIAIWLSSFKVYHEHKHVRKHIHALLSR